MDGDEVRVRVQLVAAGDLLHAELAVALGAHERIEGEHAHAKRPRAVRDQLADATEAEDAERLLVQLHAGELGPLPLAAGERHVRLRDVAREREQERHRVLGRGHHVGLGRVGNHDAAPGGRLHVHVVDAHAGAADHAQLARALDQLRVHVRGRADEDAVVLADALGELLLAPAGSELDVEVLAQQRHARVADLLGDQHLQTLAALRAARGAHSEILSTTQSMHAVRACTSPSSVAGNMPTRSWFRPSLR